MVVLEKWIVMEMEVGNGNWKWKLEMEKQRSEMHRQKNGKVNERSKWKNGKIMVKLTEVKNEKSR